MQAGEAGAVIHKLSFPLIEGCPWEPKLPCTLGLSVGESPDREEESGQDSRWEMLLLLENPGGPEVLEWVQAHALGPGALGTLCLLSVCLSASGCVAPSDSKRAFFREFDLEPLWADVHHRGLFWLQPSKSQGRTLIGLVGSCDHPWAVQVMEDYNWPRLGHFPTPGQRDGECSQKWECEARRSFWALSFPITCWPGPHSPPGRLQTF